MAWSAIRTALLAASFSMLLAGGARADDNLKIAIGQRGGWEQSVCDLGQDKGFFKKHGLTLDVLYTQGSAETLQSVISNSVDIGIGLGTHALLGAYLKGRRSAASAPRSPAPTSSSTTSSPTRRSKP